MELAAGFFVASGAAVLDLPCAVIQAATPPPQMTRTSGAMDKLSSIINISGSLLSHM